MKKLLIVVDYQNDFVDGTLGFRGAELLDARIAAKIDEYHEAGDEVAFTLDMHGRDYLSTLEGANLPIEHCIEGTTGAELYGTVGERIGACDHVFEKPTFGSKELFARLVGIQKVADEVGTKPFESIELVGLVSHICVLANAVLAKTACPEVPIIVDAACTDSFDRDLQDKAFDTLGGLQISVVNR